MAVQTTTEPHLLWFAGAVSETPSEARLRRGEEYLQLRQAKQEAQERAGHASGMPAGRGLQRHSSRRADGAAVDGGGSGGGVGGGGGGAEHSAASRQRAEEALTHAVAAVAPSRRELSGTQLQTLAHLISTHAAAARGSAALRTARARHHEATQPPPPEPEGHVLLTGAQLAWLGQQLLRYVASAPLH